MSDGASETDRHLALCPHCAYDLRGHADPTACPECGNFVDVEASYVAASRWLEHRLVDLYSISILNGCGLGVVVLSVVAMRRGQYVAVLLGMFAWVCLAAALVWFLAVLPGLLIRLRRPYMRAVAGARLRRVWQWVVVDVVLVLALPAAITGVAWWRGWSLW